MIKNKIVAAMGLKPLSLTPYNLRLNQAEWSGETFNQAVSAPSGSGMSFMLTQELATHIARKQ